MNEREWPGKYGEVLDGIACPTVRRGFLVGFAARSFNFDFIV